MTSQIDKDLNDIITIDLYIKRSKHDNGMSLKEYADAIMSGTHNTLNHDDFIYHFGTEDADLETVTNWASENNLPIIDCCDGKSSIRLSGSVNQFNQLFNIKLQNVTDDNGTYFIPDKDITVPEKIKDVVEQVLGLDTNSKLFKPFVSMSAEITPAYDIFGEFSATPAQLATAYKVPPGDGYGTCIGIMMLTPQDDGNGGTMLSGWSQSDVDASFSRIGLSSPTIVNVSTDGSTISTTSDRETMLDIYCAGGICPRAKIIIYACYNSYQGVLNGLNAVANDTVNNPSVLSISWGIGPWVGATPYGSFHDSGFQACIVKGITVFTASGDWGTLNCRPYLGCESAYQISVGGTTTELNTDNSLKSEVYWRSYTGINNDPSAYSGGGGITTYEPDDGIRGYDTGIPAPSWQLGLTWSRITDLGSRYLIDGPYNIGVGNSGYQNGRGIPDFSAKADGGYILYYRGSTYSFSGTSAASPLIAAIWARLGILLGYRFPYNMNTIYSNQTTWFNDITEGNSLYQAGLSGPKLSNQAWELVASSGWDPITGLGTPKFDQWYKYYHKGSTFPKNNYGFRNLSSATYPRSISVAGRQRS